MVLPLIIVAIALIALYFYFWYITIPATIIIIVTIWWYNKRCNRKSSTKHSKSSPWLEQSTKDSNNQYYHQHEYEDPYAEDEFDAIIIDDIFENYNGPSQIDKDKLVRTRLEKFNFSEEEAELVFGKEWKDKLGQEHYKLFSDITSMKLNLLTPSEFFKIGLSFYQESIMEKVSHIIDKVIRIIDSVWIEYPQEVTQFKKICNDQTPGGSDWIEREWEFFKKYKKSSSEYSENTLDASEAYEILGLSMTVTLDQVKERFRELALRWHPDKNDSAIKKECERKFVRINQAYETIERKKLVA